MGRILFLTQVLPFPLDAGPKVRAYYMLRHLSARHEVTLVSFVRPDDSPAAVDHLRGFCHAVHTVPMRRSPWRNARAAARGLLGGLPVVVARDEIAQMSQTVRRLACAGPVDVVHADQLSMAGYGQMAACAGNGRPSRRPRTLLDAHNAVHILARRMAEAEPNPLRRAVMAREAHAFARYEAGMCRAYDAVLTVTDEDRQLLLRLLGEGQAAERHCKFSVVPISVDPQAVHPVERRPGGPPTILHLGTMFWPPNVAGVLWFAREALPLIHRHCADARFVIVGKKPPQEVRALAADSRIEVAGYVSDPAPLLAAADVFVVPLHSGSGMRVKILDAWLWGLPVVSTPIGAEGIACHDGEDILIAADAAAFAEATLRLLRDPALNQRLRTRGRAWVEQNYAWQVVYQRADEVYSRLITDST